MSTTTIPNIPPLRWPLSRTLPVLLILTFLATTAFVAATPHPSVPVGTAISTGDSMEPTYPDGEHLLLYADTGFERVSEGDIIVYYAPSDDAYICHRVERVTDRGLITKGDNGPYVDQVFYQPVTRENYVGKVLVHFS